MNGGETVTVGMLDISAVGREPRPANRLLEIETVSLTGANFPTTTPNSVYLERSVRKMGIFPRMPLGTCLIWKVSLKTFSGVNRVPGSLTPNRV